MIHEELIELDKDQRIKLSKIYLDKYLKYNTAVKCNPLLLQINNYITKNTMYFSFLDKLDEFLFIKFLMSNSVYISFDIFSFIYSQMIKFGSNVDLYSENNFYRLVTNYILKNINKYIIITNENFINLFLYEEGNINEDFNEDLFF